MAMPPTEMVAQLVELDEKYAADILKEALSISDNVTAQKLQGGFSGNA